MDPQARSSQPERTKAILGLGAGIATAVGGTTGAFASAGAIAGKSYGRAFGRAMKGAGLIGALGIAAEMNSQAKRLEADMANGFSPLEASRRETHRKAKRMKSLEDWWMDKIGTPRSWLGLDQKRIHLQPNLVSPAKLGVDMRTESIGGILASTVKMQKDLAAQLGLSSDLTTIESPTLLGSSARESQAVRNEIAALRGDLVGGAIKSDLKGHLSIKLDSAGHVASSVFSSNSDVKVSVAALATGRDDLAP